MNERPTRGFPIGIAIIREGPYGRTTSRNVYADELTPEELADRESKGLGYPHPVDIPRLTNPTPAPQGPEPSDYDSPPSDVSDEPETSTALEASAQRTSTPSSNTNAISQPEQILADSDLVKTNTPNELIASDLPPDFSRHARRCVVCAHPDRDAIEGDFIRWASPSAMAKTYKIADRASIYRHAHSTGLFNRRKREVGRVLETVLENVEQPPSIPSTPSSVPRASTPASTAPEPGSSRPESPISSLARLPVRPEFRPRRHKNKRRAAVNQNDF